MLTSPIVKKWISKLGISEQSADNSSNENPTEASEGGMNSNPALLSTIVLPNNLKLLSDRLPKSKYDDDFKDRSSKSYKQIIREETSPSSPTDTDDTRKYRPRNEKSQNSRLPATKKKHPLIDIEGSN